MLINTPASRAAALELAIAKAGGITAMCRAMDLTHQAVSSWRKKGYVPMHRAAQLEKMWGVSRFEMMRPTDIMLIDPLVNFHEGVNEGLNAAGAASSSAEDLL